MMQRLFFSFLFAIASALSVSAQEDFSGLKVQLPDGWSTSDEESALRFKEHDIVKTAKSADNPTGELVVFGERPDGTKLTAPFVDLDKQIFSFDIDERQKQVVFCFGVSDLNNKWQPQGELVVFDLTRSEVVMNQLVNLADYQLGASYRALHTRTASVEKNNPLRLTRYGLLYRSANQVHMADAQTGNILWKKKFSGVYIDEKNDLMLGFSSPTSSKLQGIRLSTGKRIWDTYFPHGRNWGWTDKVKVSDSLLIVTANDLHFLNPLTGSDHVHESLTGMKDNGAMIAVALGAVALGAIGGAMTGMYFFPTGIDANVTAHLVSSVYCYEGKYYMSDRERLRCFDKHGYRKWATPLPSKAASGALLHAADGVLHMVNLGFGLKGGTEKTPSGRPFIATYDAGNGDELSFQYLSKKKEMIEGAVIDDDGMLLMTDDALAYKSTRDTTIQAVAWNKTAYGHLTSMPTDTIYAFRKYDEQLTPLYPRSERSAVMTDKGKTLVVDKSLKIVDDYLSDNIYRVCERFDSIDFVVSADGNGDCWFVECSGKPIAHITKPVRMIKRVGNMLYVASGKKFFGVDLNTINQAQ